MKCPNRFYNSNYTITCNLHVAIIEVKLGITVESVQLKANTSLDPIILNIILLIGLSLLSSGFDVFNINHLLYLAEAAFKFCIIRHFF